MTYIDYLNLFNQWIEDDNPTDKAIILYYSLLNMFNRRGWPRWAGVDTQRLMILARTTSKPTAFRARDALASAGLIEYRSGKKGKATEYSLKKYCSKSIPQSETEYNTENETESKNDTKNRTQSETESGTENVTPNKTKTKTKTILKETNVSFCAEPETDSTRESKTDKGFDSFWKAYPKKKNKLDAQKAFSKVKVPIQTLLDAIERQKRSEQWKKEGGQFIPYPATWLNRGAWDDEDTQPSLHSIPSEEEYYSGWDEDDFVVRG